MSTQRHTFSIGLTSAGRWLAVSSRAPFFCFEGSTEEEVHGVARRAIQFYFGLRDGDIQESIRQIAQKKKQLSTFRAKSEVAA